MQVGLQQVAVRRKGLKPKIPHPELLRFPHSQFPTPEAVLEGARYMVALQIAREPLVRQVLRQTFQERAKLNITPTKKGRKVSSG